MDSPIFKVGEKIAVTGKIISVIPASNGIFYVLELVKETLNRQYITVTQEELLRGGAIFKLIE